MTGKTHKQGGILCAIVGFILLYKYNLLIDNANMWLQFLVMYPFCIWGSVASDLDHHWKSCPQKDVVSYLINKLLHLTAPIQKSMEKSGNTKSVLYRIARMLNAKHRSWQTHSDMTLCAMLYLLYLVLNKRIFQGEIDSVLASLILVGVCIGVIAHFALDLITPEGIYIFILVIIHNVFDVKAVPEKLHLVPKKEFFATGGPWEQFIQKVLKIATILATLYLIFGIIWTGWLDWIPFEISIGG